MGAHRCAVCICLIEPVGLATYIFIIPSGKKTWCDARTRSAKRFAPLHRVKQGVAGIFNRPDTCQTAWICSNSIRVPNIRSAETSRKAKFSFFMPGPARFFCAARGGYMCISAGDKSEFKWVHAMFIFYSDAFKKSAARKISARQAAAIIETCFRVTMIFVAFWRVCRTDFRDEPVQRKIKFLIAKFAAFFNITELVNVSKNIRYTV